MRATPKIDMIYTPFKYLTKLCEEKIVNDEKEEIRGFFVHACVSSKYCISTLVFADAGRRAASFYRERFIHKYAFCNTISNIRSTAAKHVTHDAYVCTYSTSCNTTYNS